MNLVEYTELVNQTLCVDAIINNEFIGFKEDYLVIHCLLKKWNPSNIFEIGTNTGMGCRIMNAASPNSKITTLDIRPCGELAPASVTKIVGDSISFDYTKHYPIDCWFIDGNHTYENVFHETKEAIQSGAQYIIYHDADIPEITKGILNAHSIYGDKYILHRVINPPTQYSHYGNNVTRIVFGIKK